MYFYNKFDKIYRSRSMCIHFLYTFFSPGSGQLLEDDAKVYWIWCHIYGDTSSTYFRANVYVAENGRGLLYSAINFIVLMSIILCVPSYVILWRDWRELCLSQLMEYSHLLDLADECEDPYMRLVYAGMNSSLSPLPTQKKQKKAFCGIWPNVVADRSIIFHLRLLCLPTHMEAL